MQTNLNQIFNNPNLSQIFNNPNLQNSYLSPKSISNNRFNSPAKFNTNDSADINYSRTEIEYQEVKSFLVYNFDGKKINTDDLQLPFEMPIGLDADSLELGENSMLFYQESTSVKIVYEEVHSKINDKFGAKETPAEGDFSWMPEEWRPEAVAQRIVDFATGMFESFKSIDENAANEFMTAITDFLELMKGSIDEGFSQAREMLGNTPDNVSNVIDETYKLIQEKLDTWFDEQISDFEDQPDEDIKTEELISA